MRLMYEEKMFDYKNKHDAEKHIERMKEKGWKVKDQYEQDGNFNGYTWTVEFHR